MKKLIFIVCITIVTSISSQLVAQDTPSAYLIISVNEMHIDQMGPYFESTPPILEKYVDNVEALANAVEEDIVTLEGEWNFPGRILIEEFSSMEELKAYWYSDEYQAAILLREGLVEMNFAIAIKGTAMEML